MKYLRYFIFFPGLLFTIPLFSQVTGEWLSAEVEFDLPKKFTVETSLEARALNPGGIQFYKYFFQAGLNYKINKRFDVSLKNRFAWRLEENMHYYYRNKLIFDFKFDYPAGRFKFDYRARFQRISKTYINSESDIIPTLHFRNKFEFSYDVPENPIEPAVFFEVFTPLNRYQTETFDEFRIGGKVKFPLKKKQSITGRIMFIHEQFETQLSGIIFILAYKITIK